MAYIEPRKNKNGEIISYRIRVNKGYDKNGKKLKPYEMNFKPDPEKTDRQNLKALNEAAIEFERKCRQGYVTDFNRILESKASAIAKVLNTPITKIFIISRDSTPLSNKTILEYHRLINTIFKQSDKEMLIPYNPAAKATPPKANKSKINYFEYDDLEKIQAAVDKLSLKWRTIIHLLMITGCRRAELCGLKWDAIDWENERIFIHINLLYSPEVGLYEDTTKTSGSERYVTLPRESIELLREYQAWYEEQKSLYGDRWHDTNFLFFQEKSGKEGLPMSPDTVTRFLDEFSEREGLPHLNPHAFRHTMASILCYNHIDPVSISHRLGHSRVSTTTDYYSHMFKDADDINAETIADIVLRGGKNKAG